MQTTHLKSPDLRDVSGGDLPATDTTGASEGGAFYEIPGSTDSQSAVERSRAKPSEILGWSSGDTSLPVAPNNVGEFERVASVAAGLGILTLGIARRGWMGVLLAVAGGMFIRRGITGHCGVYQQLGMNSTHPSTSAEGVRGHRGINVEGCVWVDCLPETAFAAWRNFENLPRFMPDVESVRMNPDGTSHWVVSAPVGTTVEWDAEVVNEHPGELIAWQSLPEAEVENAGSVRFESQEGGCLVRVTLQYYPPAGALGAVVARIFGDAPEQKLQDNMSRFKEWIETGAQLSR